MDKVESGRRTVYHELAHCIGYILAEELGKDSLGGIDEIHLGFTRNSVRGKLPLYHYENTYKERDRLFNETSNIRRTVAWFFEVISGCAIQSIFENTKVDACLERNGKIDQDNMLAIRTLSAFKWTWDGILEFMLIVQDFYRKHEILKRLETIANEILEKIRHASDHQIVIKNNELKNLVKDVRNLISAEIRTDYIAIINNFHKRFSLY